MIRFSNGTTAAIQPESWNITRNGAIVATRTQLPLDLAWAFSVHKSQVLHALLLSLLVVTIFIIHASSHLPPLHQRHLSIQDFSRLLQGMSLDYLRVSLSKCFEAGQGCVELLLLNRFARRCCFAFALCAVLKRRLQVRGIVARPLFGRSACFGHGEMAETRGAKAANVY